MNDIFFSPGEGFCEDDANVFTVFTFREILDKFSVHFITIFIISNTKHYSEMPTFIFSLVLSFFFVVYW